MYSPNLTALVCELSLSIFACGSSDADETVFIDLSLTVDFFLMFLSVYIGLVMLLVPLYFLSEASRPELECGEVIVLLFFGEEGFEDSKMSSPWMRVFASSRCAVSLPALN